jgi:branched-chain amino acid transport system substrate-binding protein
MKYLIPVALGAMSLASAQAAEPDVNIGVILALTGAYSSAGVAEKEGVLVALEELQKTKPLGDRKINLLVEDDASDKAQVINIMSRFGARKDVSIIVGPSGSFEGVVAAPIANDLKVPMLGVSTSSPAVTAAGPWSFKAIAEGTDIIPAVAYYGADKLGIKKVVTISVRNNDGQVTQKNAAVKAFKERNVEVLAEESVLGTDTDFQSIVTKIVSLKPDALFVTLVGDQAANLIIQARQAGLPASTKILGASTLGADQFISIGGSAVDGSYFAADYFVGTKTAENKRFVEAYKAKYQRLPDNWAALGYASLIVAVEAIKEAGPSPDREAIRHALTKIKNLAVPIGKGVFSIDADRKAKYEPVVGMIKDGKVVEAP